MLRLLLNAQNYKNPQKQNLDSPNSFKVTEKVIAHKAEISKNGSAHKKISFHELLADPKIYFLKLSAGMSPL